MSLPRRQRSTFTASRLSVIELFSVTKRYPSGQMGLDDVTLQISPGQMVFLTGASGAGKTTFLKLIYCEEAPTSGSILVNGRNVSSLPRSKVPYLRRTIGVVFQSFRLIPRKTVFENVCFLPRILGLSGKEQKRLAYETLRGVGLAHRMNAFPLQLSGGEQQRVAIARALINQPDILLADEPTGNLDPDLSEEILRLLLDINRRGTTVILATHDRELIHRVGHRVLTLDQGKLADDRELPSGLTEDETEDEDQEADEGNEAAEDQGSSEGTNDSDEAENTVEDAL
ncbi:MAG: cell division ATP-binding protein FtsE [Acidobacteriota bacterium]